MKLLYGALFAAIVAVAACGCSAGDQTPPGDQVFSDPAGDQLNSPLVPDITTVNVRNDAEAITFHVTIANYRMLPPGSSIALVLDTDSDRETGALGLEARFVYSKELDGSESTLFQRYSRMADNLVDVPATSVSASFSAGVLEWSVPRSELSNTERFTFAIFAFADSVQGSEGGVDAARDEDPPWVYEL